MHYTTIDFTRTNHGVTEWFYHKLNGFSIRTSAMLLHNYIMECGIINNSIGDIFKNVYFSPIIPIKSRAIQSYLVVKFPRSTIPETLKCFPDKPRKWFPIPEDIFQCKHYCCFAQIIPWHVCKYIKIHKSQGSIS